MTRNGVQETFVTTNTEGTDGSDRLIAHVDGIMLDGVGGDDSLQGRWANMVFLGRDGDDSIIA